MDFSRRYPLKGGLPHSEISGSTSARLSPELFAACHVLHRLSVPRHSPDALLSSSPTLSPKRALRARRGQMTEHRRQTRHRQDRAICPAPAAVTRSLEPRRRLFAPPGPRAPASSHTHAQVQPRPRLRGPRLDLLHGHDLLHDVKRAETQSSSTAARNRPGLAPQTVSVPSSAGPHARAMPMRPSDLDLCPLTSETGGPGPTRTADLTLIRRAL